MMMNKTMIDDFVGKKVFVKTNSDRFYTGVIEKVDDQVLTLIDKFNLKILIELNDLKILEERPDDKRSL